MTYRKINVNGNRYEYVVGRDVTKIKGVGLFKNRDWSYTIDAAASKYIVTPWHVEGMILGHPRLDRHRPKEPCPDSEKITVW